MSGGSPADRLEARAGSSSLRLAGRNPALVAVRVVRRASDVRITGLAAETGFYLVLSILPLVTALGASLGLVRRVLDERAVAGMEETLVDGIGAVLSADLAEEVAVPLVQQLLAEEQVGTALTGVAGALWLGSRVFGAAMRALAEAHRAEERRGWVQTRLLALAFAVVAVLVTTTLLALVVVGPLLGGGRALAEALGAGPAFGRAWAIGRWPVVLVVTTCFLAWLYQVGQNANTRWRDALPGAVLATVGVVLLSVAFRSYVEVAGPQGPSVEGGSAAVRIVGRAISTVVATMLFGWLASIVVLAGGVFNAEWSAARPRSGTPAP